MGDTTILKDVRSVTGQRGRLYYYQGNFFSPLYMKRKEEERVNRAIRNFKWKHKARIERDRAHPEYKTLLELFDEQTKHLN